MASEDVRDEEIPLPVPVRHKVRGIRPRLRRLRLLGGVLGGLRGFWRFWLFLERQSALQGLRAGVVGHDGLKAFHGRSAFALAA